MFHWKEKEEMAHRFQQGFFTFLKLSTSEVMMLGNKIWALYIALVWKVLTNHKVFAQEGDIVPQKWFEGWMGFLRKPKTKVHSCKEWTQGPLSVGTSTQLKSRNFGHSSNE